MLLWWLEVPEIAFGIHRLWRHCGDVAVTCIWNMILCTWQSISFWLSAGCYFCSTVITTLNQTLNDFGRLCFRHWQYVVCRSISTRSTTLAWRCGLRSRWNVAVASAAASCSLIESDILNVFRPRYSDCWVRCPKHIPTTLPPAIRALLTDRSA